MLDDQNPQSQPPASPEPSAPQPSGPGSVAPGPVAPEPVAPEPSATAATSASLPHDPLADGPAAAVAPGDGVEPAPTTPVERRGLSPVVSHLLVAVAGIAVGALLLGGLGARGAGATGGGATPASGTFAVTDTSAGIAGAPLTIEVWADYQCPYCGLFTHGIEPTLLRDYVATGRATIVFRDFAFLGQESIDAAVAARCAGRQGKFWSYHDLLYASQSGENQGAFAMGNLTKLAEFAGLDTTDFGSCVADPAVAAAVLAETAVGKDLGVQSTPTVRIVSAAGSRTILGLAPVAAVEDAIAKVEAGDVEAADASGGTNASAGPESTLAPSGSAAP